VFTAVPLEQVSQEETEQVMLKNIRRVDYYIQRIDYTYKTHVYYNLWLQLAASGYNATSDFVFNTYLKDLALATDNIEIVSNIEIHNRLRIGAKAPEIIWNTNGVEASLSSLEGTNSYVLVFWSSTCSHCLNELPKLHGRLHAKKGVHVLAVGLEDEANYWQMESANLPEFTHAISKGKWESEAAKLYAINQTPTYFILDSEKRILAKPEDYKDVLNYLENMQTPRSQN
jgi:peroxiredoxin